MITINECKLKYEKLDEITEQTITQNLGFSANINIIIDLKEVFRKVFRPGILPDKIEKKALVKEEISSDIIGIISHYRNYFSKKGKYTTFFFFYSFDKPEFISEYPDYKKEYYEKYFNNKEDDKCEIIKGVGKIIEKVVSAIPNSFFIDSSSYDELIFIKYFVSNISNPSDLNLILSNDLLLYQLISPKTFVLEMKGISSKLITPNNSIETIIKKDYINDSFSSKMIPLLFSMAGFEKYSISKIPLIGPVKAFNIVSYLLKNNKIEDKELFEFPLKKENLNKFRKEELTIFNNFELIEKNFDVLSGNRILYEHKFLIESKLKSDIEKSKLGKYSLMDLGKIFFNYPINLSMLSRGEKL